MKKLLKRLLFSFFCLPFFYLQANGPDIVKNNPYSFEKEKEMLIKQKENLSKEVERLETINHNYEKINSNNQKIISNYEKIMIALILTNIFNIASIIKLLFFNKG